MEEKFIEFELPNNKTEEETKILIEEWFGAAKEALKPYYIEIEHKTNEYIKKQYYKVKIYSEQPMLNSVKARLFSLKEKAL